MDFASLGDEPVTFVVTIQFTRGAIERTVVTTIMTGSSPNLEDRYLAGFILLLLQLINVLAKDNG